jgi:hypothetical protein
MVEGKLIGQVFSAKMMKFVTPHLTVSPIYKIQKN